MTEKSQTDAVERQTLNLWPETARLLGLGRQAIYEAAKRGDIPIVRIGKRILVSRQALDRMLECAEQK